MIKLNKLTDYAIVILTYLAKGEKQFYTVNKIVDATTLPQPTVAKLMKQLSKLDLVSATRGAQGGYQLNIDPSDTTLADIVKAFEGPVSVTNCNSPNSKTCMIKQCCTLGPIWNKIDRELMSVLQNYTIQTLAHYEELSHFMTRPHNKQEEHAHV